MLHYPAHALTPSPPLLPIIYQSNRLKISQCCCEVNRRMKKAEQLIFRQLLSQISWLSRAINSSFSILLSFFFSPSQCICVLPYSFLSLHAQVLKFPSHNDSPILVILTQKLTRHFLTRFLRISRNNFFMSLKSTKTFSLFVDKKRSSRLCRSLSCQLLIVVRRIFLNSSSDRKGRKSELLRKSGETLETKLEPML